MLGLPDRYAEAHRNPQGAGDSRPTALHIVKDEDVEGKLTEKTIVITGCSSSIGIETARALSGTGAKLFVTARNVEKGRTALGGLDDSDRVHLVKLDLASLASVRKCAGEILDLSGGRINVLVCNAGIRHTPEGRTQAGFELQWGTNHLGHFLLFQLLKPALLASVTPTFHSRVVVVSSSGHRYCDGIYWDDLNSKSRYDRDKAYAQSKLANIYTANEIERRYGGKGLHGWSLHPGNIRTGLQHLEWADAWAVLKNGILLGGMPRIMRGFKSTQQGAATSVWAAVGRELEGKGGRYLETCTECPPVQKGYRVDDAGYEKTAYDEASEQRCWKVSCDLVGCENTDI